MPENKTENKEVKEKKNETAEAKEDPGFFSKAYDTCSDYVSENWKCMAGSAAVGAAIGAAATYFFMSGDDE